MGTFEGLTAAEAQAACCANVECAGFSFSKGGSTGSGYYKGNVGCGLTKASGYDGYTKTSQIPGPPPTAPADIAFDFKIVPGFAGAGSVDLLDIWSGATATGLRGGYTARAVPLHGSAFVLLEAGKDAVVEASD